MLGAGTKAKQAIGFKWVDKKPLLTKEIKTQFYKYRKNKNLSISALAEKLPVSRRALNDYIRDGYLSLDGPEFETKKISDFKYFKNIELNENLLKKSRKQRLFSSF